MEQITQFPVTATLIAVNIIASTMAWQNDVMMNRGQFHIGPMRNKNEWDRALTSGFLHVNVMHLLLNMYVLWGFGTLLEDARVLGSTNFAIVYFVALIGGSAWSYLENFRKPQYRALGASGAVSGVVLGVCLFAPLGTLGFFFIPMPAVVFAVGFLAISAVLSQNENKIIAHEAHLGGALAGAIAVIIIEPRVWPRFISQVSNALGLS